jgi:hypothetical protein
LLRTRRDFHELPNPLDGFPRFRESPDLEDMGHAGPGFERYGDAVGSHFLRDSDGVVAEHLAPASETGRHAPPAAAVGQPEELVFAA